MTDYDVKDPVVRRMLAHFRLAEQAENDNRTRGLRALKFRQGGAEQWDPNFLNQFKEDNRPHESYNQIPQFVHQVTNDMRMNMAQIRYIPGTDADKEVAEVYEDLARNIQTSSEAEVAYDTAADSQVTIGWGYWRYVTEYENDTTFDQVIKTKWIPNAFTVYDDPHAMEADRCDRKKLLQVCDVNVKDFNSDYDKDYDSAELSSIGDAQPQWAKPDGDGGTVRIGEYWEVTEEKTTLYRQNDKITKEKPKGKFEERQVTVPKVTWYKCTAKEVLEKQEWPGIFIPYVSVVGEQLNVDGQWKLSGLVESMIAPQKQYNYWTNAATEMVALAPKSPYIAAVGQIDGKLAPIWDKANVKNYPYLPYNPTAFNGAMLPPPQRQQNSADISSMIALVQQAQQNFYTTTGIYPASLGKQGNEVSGKAILARQREGDTSTFHFSDNMARAQRFGGRILEDLIKKIYDGSRIVRGTKEDRTTREIKINQPFEADDGTQKEYDLTTGYYDVQVTTGPSFTTKRQETQEYMQALVQADPNLLATHGDIVFSSSDMAGADKMAERSKKFIEMSSPGLIDDPKQKNEIPPQVQAALEQSQQMIEQLQQIVQQQGQELQSKQGEIAAKEADTEAKILTVKQKADAEVQKAGIEDKRIALDNRKLDFQFAQLEGDKLKARMDAKTELATTSPDMAMSDPDLYEGPPPLMTMMEGVSQTIAMGLKEVAQITAQSSQSVVDSNLLVAQSNAQIANAINTPKQIIRDDVGRVAGIQ